MTDSACYCQVPFLLRRKSWHRRGKTKGVEYSEKEKWNVTLVGIATFKGEGRRRREAFVRLFDLKSERYYVMSYQVNDME